MKFYPLRTRTEATRLAACVLVLIMAAKLSRMAMDSFSFDDAYMFYRYALNFRAGYGVAWNAGGPHVFGLTSMPWFLVILIATLLFQNPLHLLVSCSCLAGIVALASVAFFASRRARSRSLSRFTLLFPCIVVPLLLDNRFLVSWSNGMETMLGLLAISLFVEANWRLSDHTNYANATLLAVAGAFAVLVRPEALVCVLTLPALSWSLSARKPTLGPFLAFLAELSLLLVLDLTFNQLYFGSAVPLAFYAKALGGYPGYRLYLSPFGYTAVFASIAFLPLFVLALFTRRSQLRRVLPFLVSLSLVVCYLMSITQIMGWQARYYIPFLPLLYSPAVLVADEALVCRAVGFRWTRERILATATAAFLGGPYTVPFTTVISRAISRHRTIYTQPQFSFQAQAKLPQVHSWTLFPEFARSLPAGTKVEASEVGYLGACAPQVTIIDSAGLNDPYLAKHLMGVDYLLDQKPDIIWFPHPDYTRFYGAFSSDPRLLRDYVVYAQAFDFGVALRKDSPRQAQVAAAFDQAWSKTYRGFDLNQYRVTAVYWDVSRVVHATADDVLNP